MRCSVSGRASGALRPTPRTSLGQPLHGADRPRLQASSYGVSTGRQAGCCEATSPLRTAEMAGSRSASRVRPETLRWHLGTRYQARAASPICRVRVPATEGRLGASPRTTPEYPLRQLLRSLSWAGRPRDPTPPQSQFRQPPLSEQDRRATSTRQAPPRPS